MNKPWPPNAAPEQETDETGSMAVHRAADRFRRSVNAQIIVAQGHRGHRLMYARLLIDHAIEIGRHPILAVTASALASREYEVHIGVVANQIDVVTFDGSSLASMRKAISGYDTSHPIVFSEGDGWLPQLLLSKKLPMGASVLVMRSHAQTSRRLKAVSVHLAKSALRTSVRLLRGYRVFALTGATSNGVRKWEIPDPATISAVPSDALRARSTWDSSVDRAPRYWVGVVGGIGARKNLDKVAHAIAHLGPEYGLLVAGQAEVDEAIVMSWISPAREQGIATLRIQGTLDPQEFDTIVLALDCIVVAHTNEGPSGILAKAVLARTPVVTAGARSLRRDAEQLDGSVVWTNLTTEGLATAISRQTSQRTPNHGAPRTSDSKFALSLLN